MSQQLLLVSLIHFNEFLNELSYFSFFIDFTRIISYITKGVETNQPKLIQKAIRQHVTIRKHANRSELYETVTKYIPSSSPSYKHIIEAIEKLPQTPIKPSTDTMEVEEEIEKINILPTSLLPEIEIYLYTTVLMILIREKLYYEAAYTSNFLIERIRCYNRRTLDLISSKAYFYFSLAYESIDRLSNIRTSLLALYRTTCIRHDNISQAVLINLILRNYLHYNLIEQAHIFSQRTGNFPENSSNNQLCRYLYYIGT